MAPALERLDLGLSSFALALALAGAYELYLRETTASRPWRREKFFPYWITTAAAAACGVRTRPREEHAV